MTLLGVGTGIGDRADIGDVGVDAHEGTGGTATVAEGAVGRGCVASRPAGRHAAVLHAGQADEATGVGIDLIVVVGDVEAVALPLHQGGFVARAVDEDMRNDLAFFVVRLVVREDVVVPLGTRTRCGIAVGPVLVDLADDADRLGGGKQGAFLVRPFRQGHTGQVGIDQTRLHCLSMTRVMAERVG